MPVHIRLTSMTSEKPYRVQLNRRGLQGDCVQIPNDLKESPEFGRSINSGIIEVIPASEAASIQYPPVGYQGLQQDGEWVKPITVTRDEERTIATINEKGNRVEVTHLGPQVPTNVAGTQSYINQPNASQAREVSRPNASPESFQKSFNPAERQNQATQARKPANRNPQPQPPNNG